MSKCLRGCQNRAFDGSQKSIFLQSAFFYLPLKQQIFFFKGRRNGRVSHLIQFTGLTH